MYHVVSAGMLQHPLTQYRPLYDPTEVHHGVPSVCTGWLWSALSK